MEGFGDSDPTRTSQSRLHRGHPNPADVWRFRSDPSPTSQIMIELVIQGLLCLTVCMSIQMLRYILINKYIYICHCLYPNAIPWKINNGISIHVYVYMSRYSYNYIYIHTQYYSIYNYINLSGYLHVIDKPPCLPRWFSGPAPRLVEFDRLCRDQRHGPRCKGRLHHGGDESHAMNG